MCWYVYIATSAPIEPLVWRLNPEEGHPPLLHFEPIPDDSELRDNGMRALFQMPHLYYVGSSSGCSCHLAPNQDIHHEWQVVASDSGKALLDFIREYTQREPLEMYMVWEDAWNDGTAAEPIERLPIAVDTLSDENPIMLVSRRFCVFYAAQDSIAIDVADVPRYLNVDLDVEGERDYIEALLAYCNEHITTLNTPAESGLPAARIQLAQEYPDGNAAATIAQFCTLVENLPPDLRDGWHRCPLRVLNIGYDSGRQRPALVEALPAALLARVAQSFSALEITLYPTG